MKKPESLREQFKSTGKDIYVHIGEYQAYCYSEKYVNYLESIIEAKVTEPTDEQWEKIVLYINLRIGREAVKYGHARAFTIPELKEIFRQVKEAGQ